MIQPGECLLCNPEDFNELATLLTREGYSTASNDSLYSVDEDDIDCGFRWQIGQEFPNCLWLVNAAQAKDLHSLGYVNTPNTRDRKQPYSVKFWPYVVSVEVEDLL